MIDSVIVLDSFKLITWVLWRLTTVPFCVVKHAPVILFPQDKIDATAGIHWTFAQAPLPWNDFFRLPVAIDTYYFVVGGTQY